MLCLNHSCTVRAEISAKICLSFSFMASEPVVLNLTNTVKMNAVPLVEVNPDHKN